jgi:hypothetical protein
MVIQQKIRSARMAIAPHLRIANARTHDAASERIILVTFEDRLAVDVTCMCF